MSENCYKIQNSQHKSKYENNCFLNRGFSVGLFEVIQQAKWLTSYFNENAFGQSHVKSQTTLQLPILNSKNLTNSIRASMWDVHLKHYVEIV